MVNDNISRQAQSLQSVQDRLKTAEQRKNQLQQELASLQNRNDMDARQKKRALKSTFGDFQNAEKERRAIQRLANEERTKLDKLKRGAQSVSVRTSPETIAKRQQEREKAVKALNRRQKAQGIVGRNPTKKLIVENQRRSRIAKFDPSLQSRLTPAQFEKLKKKQGVSNTNGAGTNNQRKTFTEQERNSLRTDFPVRGKRNFFNDGSLFGDLSSKPRGGISRTGTNAPSNASSKTSVETNKTSSLQKSKDTTATKRLVDAVKLIGNELVVAPVNGIRKLFGSDFAIVRTRTPQGFTKIKIVGKTRDGKNALKDKDIQKLVVNAAGAGVAGKVISSTGSALTTYFGPVVAKNTLRTAGAAAIGGTTANAIINPSPENDALAIATIAGIVGPSAVSGAKKRISKVKVFSEDKISKLNSQIANLQKKGANPRGRSTIDQELRILQEQKRLYQQNLDKATKPSLKLYDDVVKSTKKGKEAPKSIVNKVARQQKKNEQVKKQTGERIETLKQKLKKIRKEKSKGANKLTDNTKATKLQKTFPNATRTAIKKTETIWATLKKPEEELLDLYLNNSTRFKAQKRALEKAGKRVKITPQKGKMINIKTGREVQAVKVEIVDKVKPTPIKKTPKKSKVKKIKINQQKELTARERKKQEKRRQFEEGQKLEKQINFARKVAEFEQERLPPIKSQKWGKKAQLQVGKSTQKGVAKVKKVTNDINKAVKQFKKQYKRPVQRSTKTPKQQRETFTARKQNVKKAVSQQKAKLKTYKKSLIKLNAAGLLTSALLQKALADLNDQQKALDNAQDDIQDTIFPVPQDNRNTPVTPKPSTPKTPSKPSTPKPRTPKRFNTKKVIKKVTPKPTKPKKTLTSRPTKKTTKNKTPKVRLPKNTPNSSGMVRSGIIQFKVGNKVTSIKTGLPYNKAVRVARDVVDRSLLASMTIRPGNRIKDKDITKVDLSKFRQKVGKNPLVRKLVEKRKNRLDTPTEKRQIQRAKTNKAKTKVVKRTIKRAIKKITKKRR